MMPGLFGFTDDQVYRYSRHIILPDIGGVGQKKLFKAKVLLVGAGGLGSPAAMYLAAAGVGTLGLVDFDRVDLSNLQRQLLHRTKDIGRPKLDSAEDTINALNPDVKVVKHPVEAMKLILGKGEPLIGRLLLFDALPMEFREMKVSKDPNCPVCSDHPTITELIDYEQFCGVPFPENTALSMEPERVPA